MSFLFSNNKKSIKAVHEDDFVAYLKSIGLFDQLSAGKYKCKFCNSVITLENLDVIVPRGKSVEFVCNNRSCLNQI